MYEWFFKYPMTASEPPRSASPSEDAFNAAALEVLGKDNPYAYTSIPFIHRTLMQFHLASQFQAHDIFNEAYVREIQFIRSGGIIQNPHAWLKRICFNIIRENSRKQRKEQLLDPELIELMTSLRGIEDSVISDEDIEKNWQALLSSLEGLSSTDPKGARLLRLQAQGLSWKEIRSQLVQEDGEAPCEQTLRQQASRAKKTLRKIYHSQTSDWADRQFT
jgi:DNA-directed RNA polymerase specialized sigma24 family protein